jgi:two-component system OmpR family response regulator
MNEHTETPSHILIVHDDPDVGKMLTVYFTNNNVPAIAISKRSEIKYELTNTSLILILLDQEVGRDDGVNLLQEIRAQSSVPVIIIGSRRTDEIDRIVALELGADDYAAEPLDLGDLFARIRAVLRRQQVKAVGDGEKRRVGYRFGGWQLDCDRRRLFNPNGTPIEISNCDYTLLLAFLEASQRPLSRGWLLRATSTARDPGDRSVDARVSRLRRKLEADPTAQSVIRAERGIGYVFMLRAAPL